MQGFVLKPCISDHNSVGWRVVEASDGNYNMNQAVRNKTSLYNKLISQHRKLYFWVIILLIVLGAVLVKQQHLFNLSQQQKNKTIPVIAATANSEDVPIYLSALGNVTPTYSVTVRTQINGILERVLFTEGQMVKAGEVIAEIDNRPYLSQLKQYQGQLERDSAQLANAKIDLNRYQKLWKQDSVAQQTLATQAALVKQLEGSVQIDQGLIDATNVNLIYCRITAPIDGRIGLRLVDPGNLVQTSDTTGIAVVNMISPITVIFAIAEDYINDVMQKVTADTGLMVEAYDRDQSKLLAKGKLLTVDNQIDVSTGTVKLKAQFDNEDNALFANQFVNIRLLVKTLYNATVIPTAAIQYTNEGNFVYVIGEDHKVIVKPVKTGVSIQEKTVILEGIKPGDLVVTAGADKLVQGSRVSASSENAIPIQHKRDAV